MKQKRSNLIMVSILGIAFLLIVALLFSKSRRDINWRTVGGAFFLQVAIGAFILYSELGTRFLLGVTNIVGNVINYSTQGIEFVFGPIGNMSLGFIFAFNVLPVIIFFSSLMAVLYHLGIMGFVIRIIGSALRKVLQTSRPESMSAAANIFVGQTEAPLVIKPFIPKMTRSELFAVMVGGLASIAGSVMAGYAGLGVELKYFDCHAQRHIRRCRRLFGL